MGKLSALLGVAALAGLGYYVGKKVFDKKKAEEAEKAEQIEQNEFAEFAEEIEQTEQTVETEQAETADFDESTVFVEEKHSSPKEKIQRASLFAVGAIKTGAEKFKEGLL